jgi:hypothetical protein
MTRRVVGPDRERATGRVLLEQEKPTQIEGDPKLRGPVQAPYRHATAGGENEEDLDPGW